MVFIFRGYISCNCDNIKQCIVSRSRDQKRSGKVPMGWQCSSWVSGLIIRIIELKNRALSQYRVGGGGGGGGCLSIKKKIRQQPL